MKRLDAGALREISTRTLGHYEVQADAFWQGTCDHDVTQNIDALLDALPSPGSRRILDFGCGPGRDLLRFLELGHEVVGLDGCAAFVQHAKSLCDAEIWHQDFLHLELPAESFDGVFANASLFHVPSQELPRVLSELHASLKPFGALFASNPRGDNAEGWSGERYGTYHDAESWCALFREAHFELIQQFYRPPGLPRAQQPWLATVWRRMDPKNHASTE